MIWRALLSLSIAEWRHHPWRHGVALLAVALGVTLASSVQMINASALSEFAQALRSVNGQPDAVIAGQGSAGLADGLLARLRLDEAVALASPVLEIDGLARTLATAATGAATTPNAAPIPTAASASGPAPRSALRVLGVDALVVAALAPDLMPRPTAGADGDRLDGLDPAAVFLNPAAMSALGVRGGDSIELQSAAGWQRLRVAGSVAAAGRPLAVLDIAAAQARFDRLGRLSRIDLRLHSGTDAAAWQARQALPVGARWSSADDAVQRVSNLSRAYRVNLAVLALVALLVGGFLVYSVVSLSVAQRTPALALLGVLGLAAADRRRWVLGESLLVGLLGSALGLASGAALAALALRLLGGDLGGGYFAGSSPTLAWPPLALLTCFVLGSLAALAGAWFPARQAEALAPAQALKGLGGQAGGAAPAWPGLLLLAAGGLLALLPPVGGLPLAAYAAVAALLAGGVALVPVLVRWLLAGQASTRSPVLLLALQRARFARQTASATVAGVVASLALSVAITVMVSSFREAVAVWLDSALPADVYARSDADGMATEHGFLRPELLARAAALPGVARISPSRQLSLAIKPQWPALTLLARPLGADAAASLALLGEALPAVAGETGVFVSEPAAAIYGWRLGQQIELPLPGAAGGQVRLRVRGIWRDYARQFGAVVMAADDYQRLSGDLRVDSLALWLQPGASASEVQAALQAAAGADQPLEMASTAALRQTSLRIFDRSFAITVYLQAVALAVGLAGMAASLSAQVLARRKEFGLLVHLGLTRGQLIRLVGVEAATGLLAGSLIGLALGLAMAVVLVHVVNPQSFHWTMPLQLPLARLALLSAAMLLAGVATALWSARRAAGRPAVMAVREDW